MSSLNSGPLLPQEVLQWVPIVRFPSHRQVFASAGGEACVIEIEPGSGTLFRQLEPYD
jgi:hypothetical protein